MKDILLQLSNLNTLKTSYNKLLEYYSQIRAKLIQIKNRPDIKLILNNIIIGSFLLIPIKLIFYTNLEIRIASLIGLIILSTIFNLREKIKIPITWILKKCLGFEFYFFFFHDIEKQNYYISTSKGNNIILYKIYFEITWFLHYLFQQFYIFINAFRLFCDVNKLIYFMLYFTVFYIIIINNQAIIMSYVGLFLILSKLLIYLSENNYSEVIKNLTEDGYNKLLCEKKLKITKKNIMIFTFWNIRDLGDDITQRSSYIMSICYLQNVDLYHNFMNESLGYEIPFDYNNNNTNIFTFATTPFLILTKSKESTKQIIHVKNVENLYPDNPFKQSLTRLFQVAKNHDTRVHKTFTGVKWIELHTTYTSCVKQKYFQTPHGSKQTVPHTNNIFGDTTAEAPLYYLTSLTEADLKEQSKNIKYQTEPPHFIKEQTIDSKIDYQDAVNLTELFNASGLSENDKKAIEYGIAGIINSVTNISKQGATFGRYVNLRVKSDPLAAKCLDDIEKDTKNNLKIIRKQAINNYENKYNKTPSESELLKSDKNYKKAVNSYQYAKSGGIYEQANKKIIMQEELLFKKGDSDMSE